MADEWFKLWHELRRDEKLEEIAAVMDVPLATVIGYWVSLLCLAHELDEDWHLRLTDSRAMRVERIAAGIHADVATAKRFLAECTAMHMVVSENGAMKVANAHIRQRRPSASPSAVYDRVKKHREKKKREALEAVDNPVDNSSQPVDNSPSVTEEVVTNRVTNSLQSNRCNAPVTREKRREEIYPPTPLQQKDDTTTSDPQAARRRVSDTRPIGDVLRGVVPQAAKS